jgi:hypothetical protein
MGNDIRTNRFHLMIFKLAAQALYPEKYRLNTAELDAFERGFQLGKSVKLKNLNQTSFEKWQYRALGEVRAEIGLEAVA